MPKLIYIAILFLIYLTDGPNKITTPKVANGKIIHLQNFHSNFINARNIDIWLPPGYHDSMKFSVLYMHDGQMLFDPDITWNKQAWNVDEVCIDLFEKKQINKFIVVGIWNDGANRHADYFPQKPFANLTTIEKDTLNAQLKRAGKIKDSFAPQSDSYLKFIVKELKPYIDQNFSVYPQMEKTFIAGSSMGGLISLYAVCEYPEIFAGAACLSTHWTGTSTLKNNPVPYAIINYLNAKLPKQRNHKFYFDCGDKTLDALYPAIQSRIDSLMIQKGYKEPLWITKYFPGADHSEKSWNARLSEPLIFLFNY